MAERRMFAKTIIDSDAFLDMPVTARLLYYDLAMRADDDGFINSPKKIIRIVGATQEDLETLIANKFILQFECGVVVIKHWRIHNHIRRDVYHETKYKEEKEQLLLDENNAYTTTRNEHVTDTLRTRDGDVVGPSTQVRLGKDRIGKDRIGKDRIGKREKENGSNEPTRASGEPPKPQKHKHGEYNHVLLTDEEVEKLKTEYGSEKTEQAIIYLDEYIEMKGVSYKNHYLVLRKWVFDALREKEQRRQSSGGTSGATNKTAQELDDFYRMAQEWAESGA